MKAFLIIFSAFPTFAAITNVQVSAVTPSQAVISYTAPNTTSCTIQVSESATFSPMSHDVDTSLFTGANLDSRTGSFGVGTTSRVIVVGKHDMAGSQFKALDGNYYSRALQANTLHYYRIQCVTDTASGTFTTNTIPLGNTYAEPLASDPTNPGAYTWPTVTQTSSRSETFTDPNTGALVKKITLPGDSSVGGGVINYWPSGGMMQLCSHLLTYANGHSYNLCEIPGTSYPTIVSVETDTGIVYPLTRMLIPYGQLGCTGGVGSVGSGVTFSSTNALKMYFTSICNNTGTEELFVSTWSGALNVAYNVNVNDSNFYLQPDCPGCRNLGLITPSGLAPLLAAFDSTYNSTQQAALNNVALAGEQNGKLVFGTNNQQDSIGWMFVFDPGNDLPIGSGGTGSVIAANPFWNRPVSRWCSYHTLIPSGDNNPWIHMGSNALGTPKCEGNWCGPWYLTIASSDGYSTTIHLSAVNGSYQPVSDYTPTYLQDLAVGDQVHFGDAQGDYEHAEVASIDTVNHTVTLIRGNNLSQSLFVKNSDLTPIVDTLWNVSAGDKLYMGCRATSFSSRVGQNGGDFYWNYVNDPHGTSITYPAVNGTTSNQVVENYIHGGHVVNRDSVNIMDGWNRWDYPNSIPGYDLVSFYNGAAIGTLNPNPSFAGVQPMGVVDTYQLHPSYDQMAAPSNEKQWLLDAVPMTNESDARYYSAVGALVGGQTNTYKMGSMPTIHRKQLTTLASCGSHPLVDISSPTTGNVISDSTTYSYCVANAANECRTGASAGDVYVNCPSAANLTCNTESQLGPVDICIGDSWAYANGAAQVSTTSVDQNGAGGRLVSDLFATHHNEFRYNNVHPTADGTWMLFGTSNLTGTLEAYMAKLPPFPTAEPSPRLDTFVSTPIAIPTTAGGATAIVKFGYAEDGDPDAYNCTTRAEPCVAQSASVNESTPFYFATTEAGSITGLACASGCAIAVPAVPNRLVYYDAILRNSGGSTVYESIGVAGGSTPAPPAPTLTPALSFSQISGTQF